MGEMNWRTMKCYMKEGVEFQRVVCDVPSSDVWKAAKCSVMCTFSYDNMSNKVV